jgi:hypothetical protein
MLVELSRRDLATLLAGTLVPLDMTDEVMDLRFGWFNDMFRWDIAAVIESNVSDEDLLDLYKRIQNYWYESIGLEY